MNKKDKEHTKNKKSSIKVKLIIIPLLVVLLGISAIGTVSYYSTRKSLLNEMKENGLTTSAEFISRLGDNTQSLEFINKMIDDKITTAANTTKLSKNNLSDELLKKLADGLDVEEISNIISDLTDKTSSGVKTMEEIASASKDLAKLAENLNIRIAEFII